MLLFKLEMLIHFFKFASPSGDSKNLKLCHVKPKSQKKNFRKNYHVPCYY